MKKIASDKVAYSSILSFNVILIFHVCRAPNTLATAYLALTQIQRTIPDPSILGARVLSVLKFSCSITMFKYACTF